MKLDLTDMLYSLSYALDSVETELLGLDTGHGKRVACLAMLMAKKAGFKDEELRDFIGCCILHDNALTEYIHEELEKAPAVTRLPDLSKTTAVNSRHSVIGEQNISLLPFRTDVKNIILYHHENADGSGEMKTTSRETGLKSQILHLADMTDMSFRLREVSQEDFDGISAWARERSGGMFSKDAVSLFSEAVSFDDILALRADVKAFLRGNLPTETLDYTDEEIHNIAKLFARIVDYKSEFTQKHSEGVAEKAEMLARRYGFDGEKTTRFFFAGALHDIGKLAVGNSILEKPDKLTAEEFTVMKDHAAATRAILSEVKDIPDIIEWAGNHHEKLNGKGYPRGLCAEQLSFEDRLMACIDIYQALTEPRPYKAGMPHEKAVSIMRGMAEKGEIDPGIVNDVDKFFA